LIHSIIQVLLLKKKMIGIDRFDRRVKWVVRDVVVKAPS